MKRAILPATGLAFALLVVACGGSEEDAAAERDQSGVEAAVETAAPAAEGEAQGEVAPASPAIPVPRAESEAAAGAAEEASQADADEQAVDAGEESSERWKVGPVAALRPAGLEAQVGQPHSARDVFDRLLESPGGPRFRSEGAVSCATSVPGVEYLRVDPMNGEQTAGEQRLRLWVYADAATRAGEWAAASDGSVQALVGCEALAGGGFVATANLVADVGTAPDTLRFLIDDGLVSPGRFGPVTRLAVVEALHTARGTALAGQVAFGFFGDSGFPCGSVIAWGVSVAVVVAEGLVEFISLGVALYDSPAVLASEWEVSGGKVGTREARACPGERVYVGENLVVVSGAPPGAVSEELLLPVRRAFESAFGPGLR